MTPQGGAISGAGPLPPKGAVPADGSGAMFDAIAGRYDRLNRILSLGLDRGWRRAAVAALGLPPGAHVLDLATGTADLALETVRRHPHADVIGIDPAAEMLRIGEAKVRAAGSEESIVLGRGTAESLPFEDRAFDGATIAFGIRNVPDRRSALSEMARVVRSTGRVAVLDFTEPRGGLLAALARWHVHHVVPRLGALLSGAPQYRYLQTSIAAFPTPAEFAAMMEAAGLEVLEIRPLTFGVCHLWVARPRREPAPRQQPKGSGP